MSSPGTMWVQREPTVRPGVIRPIQRFRRRKTARFSLLLDNSIRGNLSKHVQRIEPSPNLLKLDFVVDCCNCHALNIDRTAMGFRSDLFASTVYLSESGFLAKVVPESTY